MRVDDWGTLEAGKRADLIVVDGRPDLDIGITRSIDVVMQRGVILDRPAVKYDPQRDKSFGGSAPVD